jgi:hypothetical protein
MSDYSNIHQDTADLADGLGDFVDWLKEELVLWANDRHSPHFDPDWTVNLRHEDVVKLINALSAARGLLSHIAHFPHVTAALAEQQLAAIERAVNDPADDD